MTSKRILKHYKFGKIFARLNRNIRGSQNEIKRIRMLYQNYGLISDGCSLCKNSNFTLLTEGDRYGFGLITKWQKSKKDSVSNIRQIEQTYRGILPHL